MPSGPRKRKAARRKQQEQNTSDDRDTEKDSVSESYDEHDEDSPKTPGKGEEGEGHCGGGGGAALDKDALSGGVALDKDALTQQTEEWLRVSSFDVGTPPPQTPTKLREGEFDDVDSSNSVPKTSNGTEGSNHAEPYGNEHGSSAAATGIPKSSAADDGDDQIQVNAEHGHEEEEKEESIPAPQEFHCINTYQSNTSAADDGTVLQSEKHAAVITSQPGDKVVTLSCKVHEQQQVLPPPPAGCCGVLDWIMGRSD